MSKRSILPLIATVVIVLSTSTLVSADIVGEERVIVGERLDPATYGPSVVEGWDAVIARDLARGPATPKGRNGAQGTWAVPSPRATCFPHSGQHHATNKWGDTRMGIGFPEVVDVHGAYFAGQSGRGAWTTGVRVVGYRDGQEVRSTDWFRDIGSEPKWFAMDLRGVDRIVIESESVLHGGGWYGMDDLTFSAHRAAPARAADITVVDFEDAGYRTTLTGTGYAGLTWETGTGDFSLFQAMPPPRGSVEEVVEESPLRDEPPLRDGTAPTPGVDFDGVHFGSEGQWTYPPDSMGAVGPSQYCELVNEGVSVYNKDTGSVIMHGSVKGFFNTSDDMVGDVRILFDQDSRRWFAIATNFEDTIFLNVSKTESASIMWFKTSFIATQGPDALADPDYPTLGVDENGIYITCYMAGRNRDTIFAIDKAPLIDPSPSLGDITAFRSLGHESYQPAHTYGSPGGEYVVSRQGSSALHLYRVDPPLEYPPGPTLSHMGYITIPSHSTPPDAPALGSTTNLDTLNDARLMMSVYRDGSLWTAHTIGVSGRCACRWYELDPVGLTYDQYGTVSDGSLHYFFPSIMVNSLRDAVMAFTGSKSSQYAATYYTGRRGTDPDGEMAPPVMYKAGEASYNVIDPWGRNRWGDYSYCTLDPDDDLSFWTVQEYTRNTDEWGTWITELTYPGGPAGCRGDANCDGTISFTDIAPFVEAVDTGVCACDPTGYNCDVNGDGTISFTDIAPFVDLVDSGATCP